MDFSDFEDDWGIDKEEQSLQNSNIGLEDDF